MNPLNKKYCGRVSLLIVLSYILILAAGITDLHKVDITLSGHWIDAPQAAECSGSGYLFNDENNCTIHQVVSSLQQIAFSIIQIEAAPDVDILSFFPANEFIRSLTGSLDNSLRAPPASA